MDLEWVGTSRLALQLRGVCSFNIFGSCRSLLKVSTVDESGGTSVETAVWSKSGFSAIVLENKSVAVESSFIILISL